MKLKRHLSTELSNWYNSPLRRSPLVLFGARQVGKSTLAQEFAAATDREVIKINFWKDSNDDYKKIVTAHTPQPSPLIQMLTVVQLTASG
ncbi:MAG: AAA family ATPase [Oligoflexia bacterium]|nr:AAA family ATPase [Oligoflexia bacterium]